MATSHVSDQQIEQESNRVEISKIAAYLQEHLGQRITAYLSGLKDQKTVGQWVAGRVKPRDLTSARLRHAYLAARVIARSFDDQTVKAWFFGTNRQLDDHAPAFVLRQSKSPETFVPVVRAARSFVESSLSTEDVKHEVPILDISHFVALFRNQTQRLEGAINVSPTGKIKVLEQTREELEQTKRELEQALKRVRKDSVRTAG